MAIGTQQRTTTSNAPDTGQSYRGPLMMVTTLFFMWGFLTCLNDILIPHLKAIFDLNYAQVMLVQIAFFGAYSVFSIPAGIITERVGYKPTMVAGLLPWRLGALLFIPAANVPSFPLFLAALFWQPESPCSRWRPTLMWRCWARRERHPPLDLTQAFNSLGTHCSAIRRHADSGHRAKDHGRRSRHVPAEFRPIGSSRLRR